MTYKFQCSNCKRKKVEGHWHSLFQSGKIITLCNDCFLGNVPKKRIPLTAWEKKKLQWYRSEKKWQDHISSRRVLPSGQVAVVDRKGNVKEVWD